MKNFIIKIILLSILSFFGGFFNAFLKDKNIDATFAIYFSIGYFNCLIVNWRWD